MNRATRCSFCGTPGTSEEDVFAKWIARVLGGEVPFKLGRAHGRDKTGLRYLGVTSRAACRTCNNEWMSRSEQATKPLLTPPIQGRPASWTRTEQTTVAAWAFKTALMLDRSNRPERYTVPATDFTYLFEHRHPPPSRTILLGHYFPKLDEVAFMVWTNTAWMTAHHSAEDKSEGYSISFTVGHVLFLVSGFADERLVLADRPITVNDRPIPDVFRPLWPLATDEYRWPPQGAHFDTSGLSFLQREPTPTDSALPDQLADDQKEDDQL